MKHWRIEHDADIVTLTLDVAEQSANILSREVMSELDQLLATLEASPPRGLVIRSAKPSGFIAGADVREFTRIEDAGQAAELARTGQRLFTRLARLPGPTVAAIHGYCLGGGLELALACRYRVAREGPDTRLGLPEVRLGINPGFGGTVRLPPLIGPLPALDLMLSGRSVRAAAARRLGLVDEVVPERHLLAAARALIGRNPAPRRAPAVQRLLASAPLRPLVTRIVLRGLRRKARADHYPAPYRIVDLWRRGAGDEEEARSLGELMASPASRSLVRVFLLGEELKRRGRARPHAIERVHVVGAGVMGADIAMVAASRGFQVSLQDMKPEVLARAMGRAQHFFKDRLKEPRAVQEAMDRFMPDRRGDGLARADLVIEAIVEKLEPKQKLFADLEARVGPQTVLATNTSSIPLETIARVLKDPSRLVGLHFFNPVPKMQLVEIVRGAHSRAESLDRARAFTVALDKLPLDVKSSPGFLVNRILMPYLLEAVTLLEEGVRGPVVDRAARDFGMPMGPIELADTVGLDICLSVAEELAGPLGVPVPAPLKELVASGRLGKKSGQGFYRWDGRGRPRVARAPSGGIPPRLAERLVLRMLNEAAACLREGIVSGADAVDAGMVYGTGFAPFRGGPMHHARTLGAERVREMLDELARECGARYHPDAGWSDPALFAQPA